MQFQSIELVSKLGLNPKYYSQANYCQDLDPNLSLRFIGEESTAGGVKCELTKQPTWVIDPIGFPLILILLSLFFNYTPQDDHTATVLNFRWYDQLHPQQSQHLHHSSVHGGRGWNNPSTTNCLIIQLIKFDHLINLQAQIDQIDQEVEFSIVHNPILKQTWTARKGQGAFCNGKRIKVLVAGTHRLVWETTVTKLS